MSCPWDLKTSTAEAEMSCMNALPLSRLVQKPGSIDSFFILVMDGQSWPISDQKKKGVAHTFSLLANPYTYFFFYGRKLFYRLSKRNIFTNCCIDFQMSNSPPQQVFFLVWVFHLGVTFNRFFFLSSFIRVLYRYLKVTLGEHTSYHMF